MSLDSEKEWFKDMKKYKKKSKNQLIAEAMARDQEAKWTNEYKEKLKRDIDAIPKEVKQKYIKNMNNGMKLGDAARDAGITDIVVAAQILAAQIRTGYEWIADIE